MPEAAQVKIRQHPMHIERGAARPARRTAPVRYAELAVTSNFTFLTGASHPDELVAQAAALGHSGAAIADTNTLAGVVRAHVEAKDLSIPLAVGSRLRLTDPAGLEVLAFAASREGYSGLCRLLTRGKRRAPKGECELSLEDLLEHERDLLAVAMPPTRLDNAFAHQIARLRGVFGERLSLAVCRVYGPDDGARVHALDLLSRDSRVPLAAVNDAHYHEPSRRPLQDVLTCVRHGCTIEQAGFRLHANAERHLKPPEEMARLFPDHPAALARAAEIVERAAAFSLDQLRYEYPVEPCPPGVTPMRHLVELTRAGAAKRYPGGVPDKVEASLRHELELIEELRYEAYFLTCHDVVAFARSRGILCQGRGGAANSAVCYCLGITEVDPARFQLLFERFVSRERGEPPDIDIDIEHERREEVIQYLYRKYGRDRAALTAEVITYRGRSAIRDMGKAMGLSLDRVDALAKSIDFWRGTVGENNAVECGLDISDPTVRRVLALTDQLTGFPRHLSQHVGGFVITRSPLCELVPIENAAMEDRTVIEWDKDDIDAMGMLKVDCLGLGMLTCIRKSFGLIAGSRGRELSIPRILRNHAEDPAVYEMIQRADTVGVFQIESRAQMTMLPRLKPKEFYDLVIEVAIVRPGPIQGKMVHPYLRRRTGEEPVTFPNAQIEEVLGRTLGVPLFQEQAMRLAIVAAGFTPDEADKLRRAMAAWRRKGDAIEEFRQKIVEGMVERGYSEEFAGRCFEQIQGFSEYGFPESHAASFALLVYVSSWLKRHEPAAFAAALINSQPMGFYKPAQIVRDAQEHGVEVRPVDVNRSAFDCTLEEGGDAIRLGMRLVKGMPERDAHAITEAVRRRGPFASIEPLWRASGASVGALRALARADAFASMGLGRREALWQVKPLRNEPLPLFAHLEAAETEGADSLPKITPVHHVRDDYQTTGLSLKAHPMSFLRERVREAGVIPAGDLRSETLCPNGRRLAVAGVVLVRQRPGTASGVVFITIEDETGIANLVVWPRVYERFRPVARAAPAIVVRGRVEREGEVVHIHAESLRPLDEEIAGLEGLSRDFH